MQTLRKASSLASFQKRLLEYEDDIANEPSYNKMGSKQKREFNKKYLFPQLNIILSILPMWITKQRTSMFINIIGFLLTFMYNIYYSINSLCFGCVETLFLSDLAYHTIWSYQLSSAESALVNIEEAIRIPLQTICQLMFYAKYFTYFWSLDQRDNKMSYYLYHSKNKMHSFFFGLNAKKLNIWINIIIIICILLIFIATSTLIIQNQKWYKQHYIFAPTSIFFVTIFRRLPHSIHILVVFLYLFEWKCRIKYFHEIEFLKCIKAMDNNNNNNNNNNSNSLIFKYKKMRKLMMYQLFWIKLWMFGDLISSVVNIWYKLYLWLGRQSTLVNNDSFGKVCQTCDIIYGICVIIYFLIGVGLTWLMAASLSQESENLFQFAVKQMEKLSPNYQVNDNRKISQIQILTMAVNDNNNSNDNVDQYRLDNLEQIQEIQTFLLYYNEKSVEFKILGVKISYGSLINALALFVIGKIVDFLWAVV